MNNPTIKGYRVLWALASSALVLAVTLTIVRGCQAAKSMGWNGPFGTIDYARDPGALRYIEALERRDTQ